MPTSHGSDASPRFAILVSRFNEDITAGLLDGAVAAFDAAGVPASRRVVLHVPGAFELPLAAQRLAATGTFSAVVCLGCLIKGDTMHFEYIAEAVVHGLMRVALDAQVPVAFGVLTTTTEAQAMARSRPGPDNKGAEAARAAIDMATILPSVDGSPVS
jgi:6,7-dimethyl-8-ribityllumazine synthase